ncbi:MAG TPA: hypothetical protein VIC26_01100 [Marinagarivorans sp.]
MQIYIMVDQPDFGEREQAAIAAVTTWVEEHSPHATLVHTDAGEGAELELGIEMQIKAAKQLIPPLNDFYAFAKEYKCDFVVGLIDGDEREDVCFFGHEEGKADAFEVGCYLGFD